MSCKSTASHESNKLDLLTGGGSDWYLMYEPAMTSATSLVIISEVNGTEMDDVRLNVKQTWPFKKNYFKRACNVKKLCNLLGIRFT